MKSIIFFLLLPLALIAELDITMKYYLEDKIYKIDKMMLSEDNPSCFYFGLGYREACIEFLYVFDELPRSLD